jgi:hypothetical protein
MPWEPCQQRHRRFGATRAVSTSALTQRVILEDAGLDAEEQKLQQQEMTDPKGDDAKNRYDVICIASIIRVESISETVTTLAVTSN